MLFIKKSGVGSGTFVQPDFRTTPAHFVGGSPAITQQTDTVVGDLVVIVAFSTSGSLPDEASPGTLMTTVDTLTAIRSGRLAYRIATTAGTASLSTWGGSINSYGIFTIKKDTFNPSTPFNDGGAGYFFTSEPDGNIPYPALTAPPNSKCMAFFTAYSNLGPVHYGLVSGATSMWDRDATNHYSRGQYKAQESAFAGQTVSHITGTAAQTLACSGYIVGAG